MSTQPASNTGEAPSDFADFAQEFLRRNPAYRADYHAWATRDRHTNGGETERACEHWGLVFPNRP
jgi:hypothetical protein